MVEYPEAPRHIPATPALMEGWCGPVQDSDWSSQPLAWVPTRVVREDACFGISLDPARPEVRDHLIRRLNLPGWMRDGAGLEAWQSAGLIACAAAGVVSGDWFSPWNDSETWTHYRAMHGVGHLRVWVYKTPEDIAMTTHGWAIGKPLKKYPNLRGHETGEAGKVAADAAALAHGRALMLDADTMVLPWLGGPRVWRRT